MVEKRKCERIEKFDTPEDLGKSQESMEIDFKKKIKVVGFDCVYPLERRNLF